MTDKRRGPNEQNFAEQLRLAREAQGISQAQLARLATAHGFPMGQQTVAKIEGGQQTIALDAAGALAAALGRQLVDMLQAPESTMTAGQAKQAFEIAETQLKNLNDQLTQALRRQDDAARKVYEIRVGLAAGRERMRLLTARLGGEARHGGIAEPGAEQRPAGVDGVEPSLLSGVEELVRAEQGQPEPADDDGAKGAKGDALGTPRPSRG